MVKKKKEIQKKEDKEMENVSKKQVKNENVILRNLLLGIGIFVLAIVLVVFALGSIRSFDYEGVDFEVVKFCDVEPCLITYQTSVPYIIEGNIVPYNFYIRNDPRKLKEVTFEGDLHLLSNLVIDSEESFNCDGDGVIAIANLVTLYDDALGVSVLKDENATCSNSGDYMFLTLKSGNETKIEQTGQACYDIYINDCEILEGTERFMVETFVEVNKLL